MPFTLVSQIVRGVKRVSLQVRSIIQCQAEGREIGIDRSLCRFQKEKRCGKSPQREKSVSKNS